MDTNLITYNDRRPLYPIKLNTLKSQGRALIWPVGIIFRTGNEGWPIRLLVCFCYVRSSWLRIKLETLRLFVLLSYAIETCRIQETFLANITYIFFVHYGREFVENFCLSSPLVQRRWIRGRTVAKTTTYNLRVVKSFKPDSNFTARDEQWD